MKNVLHRSLTKFADHSLIDPVRQYPINNIITLDHLAAQIMALSTAHTQIARILEMAKETHWLENKHLPPDEIQRQWANKSAPLAAVLGVDAPTHPIDLNTTARESAPLRTAQTPRLHTVSSAPIQQMKTTKSVNTTPTAPRSMDQPQTSEPMISKRSSHSNFGSFVNTGTAVKPLALHSWQTDNEEPFSSFTVPASPRPAKARKTANGSLPIQIPEYSSQVIEYEPAEYVQRSQATLSPAFSPSTRSRRNSNQQRSLVSPLSQSPATSSNGFTNATTISSADMQRQDSFGGSSLYRGVDMMRLDSRRSEVIVPSDNKANDPPFNHPLSFTNTPVSDAPVIDFSLSVSHAGGMVADTIPSSNDFISRDFDLSLGFKENGLMERTSSLESSSSQKSRISRRSEEQAVLSTRPLAPKDDAETMSRQPSSSSSIGSDMALQMSADGSKVAIQKTKYTRPPHDRAYCTMCTIKPEGFRGPHELRRHVENKHGATRKMWVCKDTSPDQMFLAKCKACREKKTYGAYYNAGAHLRRIHFNPREKGKKNDKSTKARGGDGGGDYPPMDILKLWMEEIDVPVTKNMPRFDDYEDQEEDGTYQDVVDSQDDVDFQAGGFNETLPDMSSPFPRGASSEYVNYQYQQYAPMGIHNVDQMSCSTSEDAQSLNPVNYGKSPTNFGFPPFNNNKASEVHDCHATTRVPPSVVPAPQLDTNTMSSSSQNQSAVSNECVQANLSFDSSIDYLDDHHDMFGHDFFNFS